MRVWKAPTPSYSGANPTFVHMVTFTDVLKEPMKPCPACGSDKWKDAGQVKDYSVTGEWFELKECSNCQLKATYPAPKEAEIGRYYASAEYISHSDTRKGLTNKLYHQAREWMLKKKQKWVEQASGLTKGTLLDIGAGTGHFAAFMASKGWDVIALEPDAQARKVGKEKLGLDIQPLENLAQQPEEKFDVVTLWHVLEHVHDLNGYMNHFKSILKPEGVLIIAVPNHLSKDAVKYGNKWAAYDVPRHLWHFSPRSMEILLQRHQFSLQKKIPMPLDGYYVSMLSEKYQDNGFIRPLSAFLAGTKSLLASRKNSDQGSSLIYVARKI